MIACYLYQRAYNILSLPVSTLHNPTRCCFGFILSSFQIKDGVIDKEDLDVVISTTDAIADMIPIRALLRDKFPNKARGNTLLFLLPDFFSE
jgi:hypothetical protein